MKILFVCNQNQHRSKTAEEMFKSKYETKSAGLWNSHPLTSEQLNWADKIIVMEDQQRSEIARRFPNEYMSKQIVSIAIPDVYHYGQPELKKLIKKGMTTL